MPLLHNTDTEKSIIFLKKIIDTALHSKKGIIIFDRLFFTHIFRTKSSIHDFKEIEDMIKDMSLLVFLKVDEFKILERILNARKYREKSWNEYIGKKGSDEEVYKYYVQQQKTLLRLVSKTSLKSQVYDTSNMNFKDIAKNIAQTLL